MNPRLWMATLLVLGCTGCSTMPASRESAKFGVGAIGLMQKALEGFQADQALAVQARRESLARQHKRARDSNQLVEFTTRIRESAGDTEATVISKRLIDNADAIASDEKQESEAAVLQSKTLAVLTEGLSSTQSATDEAQKKLALLAADLSPSAQFADAKGFALEVKAAVDANRKKIEAAKKAATKATPP